LSPHHPPLSIVSLVDPVMFKNYLGVDKISCIVAETEPVTPLTWKKSASWAAKFHARQMASAPE